MPRRAKRLRAFFALFCAEYNCEEMLLNNEIWRQINYLLCITKPFFEYITELLRAKEVTNMDTKQCIARGQFPNLRPV
jgi:hypothetical protein